MLLNVTLLVFAGCALFVGQSWVTLLEQERNMTANTVGVLAGVEENSVNMLALQLEERERELDARELALVRSNAVSNKNVLLGMMLTGVSLFGLIMFNFYMDSKRRMSLVE